MSNQPTIRALPFGPDWELSEYEIAIRKQENALELPDGTTTPTELTLFSVDTAGTINVGHFEDQSAPPDGAVRLVDDLPTNADDEQEFIAGLGRRNLDVLHAAEILVGAAKTLTKVAVCRETEAPPAPVQPTAAPAQPAPAPVPVPVPAATPGLISVDAFNLILEFEGLDQPGKWPGASSGVTLGVGYDLGFVTRQQFAADWGPHLTSSQITRLNGALGKTKGTAKSLAPSFSDIKIMRTAAMEVFNRCTLPRFAKITATAFPGLQALPLNAQGALISLVFNRGSAMQGSSRREMAAIRRIIQTANLPANLAQVLNAIAAQIRSMKRLWDPNKLRGLHRRRDAEAAMVAGAAQNPGTLIQVGAGGAPPQPPAPAPVQPPPQPPSAGGVTGADIVALAARHCNIGERYRLGAFVPKDKKDATGPWDCAEFVSWCIYQLTGTLIGCEDNSGPPSKADAYTGYWQRDAAIPRLGQKISIAQAASIPGAVLLRNPPRSGTGHIAFSDGNGGTLEAKGTQFGVVRDKIAGRRWDTGFLPAGINYTAGAGAPPAVAQPTSFFVGAPGMNSAVVTKIQQKLAAAGFDPGPIDGDFGDLVAGAVLAFQTQRGLMADGEVGPETAAALGV